MKFLELINSSGEESSFSYRTKLGWVVSGSSFINENKPRVIFFNAKLLKIFQIMILKE